MIVDPPNGKLPSMTPEGQKRMGERLALRNVYSTSDLFVRSPESRRRAFVELVDEDADVRAPAADRDHPVSIGQARIRSP